MDLSNTPKDYRYLFLDMDSYFASVEQQVRPEIRGQPIAVTPYTGPSGCVIAKSYAAKACGVKTGFSNRDAKQACPQILVLESRPALYMFYHREIVKMLEGISPYLRILSVDEFVFDLPKNEQNEAKIYYLASEIKRRLRSEIGDYLTCSVGVGPNLFLAKMSGEYKKPDGFFVATIARLSEFYQNLSSLTDITGINTAMERQLQRRGIMTALQFYQTNLMDLSHYFGHMGKLWYYRLRGYEVDNHSTKNRHIGHSHILGPELRTWEKARAVLIKLVKKAGTRLRKGGFWAGGVYVAIRFLEGGGYHRAKKTETFRDNQTFLREALFLYDSCRSKLDSRAKPMGLAISAFNITKSKGAQISILPAIEKSRQTSEALDKINDEFGPDALFPASMLGIDSAAPDRIPYGEPRYDIQNF